MNSEKSPGDLIIWTLVDVFINPDAEGAELYYLLLDTGKGSPLTKDGRIIFFVDKNKAASVLKKYGSAIKYDEIDIDEPSYSCNIANMLYLLTNEDYDENVSILCTINTLLDLVYGTAISIPGDKKKILYDLADHFTFSKSISEYYAKVELEPDEVINAILWCIGAVTVMSTIVDP